MTEARPMINPTESDIGRAVVFHDVCWIEQGVITSVTPHFVFVRYGSDLTSRATRRCDLTWLANDDKP